MTPKTKKGVATIDRGIVESPVWEQGPLAVQLWIWLVLTAVYSPDGFTMDNGVALRRGQLWTTYRLMAKALRYRWAKGYKTPPIATIKRIIDGWLVERQVERLVEHNGIVLTLVNYEYYNRFKIISGTVGGTIDKTLVEQEVDKASTEEEKQLLSPPGKIAGEESPLKKRRAKLRTSPHYAFMVALCRWFHANNPHAADATSMSEASQVKVLEKIEQLLRINMDDAPGCEERLWRIVHYAATDTQFWQKNLLSLGALRDKNGSDIFKFKNIESKIPPHIKTPPMPTLEGEHHG